MSLSGKDKFLAKVALEDGLLSKEEVREAARIQEELKAPDGALPELSTVLAERGFLDGPAVKSLLLRTKERYFQKLYLKVKAEELGVDVRDLEEKVSSGSGESDPPPGDRPKSDPSQVAHQRRSRGGSSTSKKRRPLRARQGSPRWVVPVLVAAGAALAAVGIAVLSSASSDPDSDSSPGASEGERFPAVSGSSASGTEVRPDPGRDRPKGPSGLFGRTDFEKEVEQPSVLEKVEPPPRRSPDQEGVELSGSERQAVEAIEAAFQSKDWDRVQTLCREFARSHPDHQLGPYFSRLAGLLESPDYRRQVEQMLEGGSDQD